MSARRPSASPLLFAALAEAAPGRLLRKLDKSPELAEGWSWAAAEGTLAVTTDKDVVVTLSPAGGVVSSVEHVGCTCLLAPRCLHILAVVSRLPLADDDAAVQGDGDAEADEQATGAAALADRQASSAPAKSGDADAQNADAREALRPSQHAAAEAAWRSGAAMLEGGASGAGALSQAELARVAHECRAVGLHRLATASMRVLARARALRDERPEQRLGDFADQLAELLEVAAELRALHSAAAPASLIGTARRAYDPAGSLRLYGLTSQAVVSAGGALVGMQTLLADSKGRLHAVVDTAPAAAGPRATGAYERATRLSEGGLSHRDLCRRGLFVSGATRSADGRLGAGRGVKAVAADPCSLRDEPLEPLFTAGFEQQVARAHAAAALPEHERCVGDDLLFLRDATVLGTSPRALWLAIEGVPIAAVAESDHAALYCRRNLELLARAPGMRLDVIARLLPQRPRTVALLTIAAAPPPEPDAEAEAGAAAEADASDAGPELALPNAWANRCNLGLDLLTPEALRNPARRAAAAPLEEPRDVAAEALRPLRRRLERLALGGRATLPPEAARAIAREAALLDRRLLRGAADALRDLGDEAWARARDLSGQRRQGDPDALARAFVGAAIYERAARRALARSGWTS